MHDVSYSIHVRVTLAAVRVATKTVLVSTGHCGVGCALCGAMLMAPRLKLVYKHNTRRVVATSRDRKAGDCSRSVRMPRPLPLTVASCGARCLLGDKLEKLPSSTRDACTYNYAVYVTMYLPCKCSRGIGSSMARRHWRGPLAAKEHELHMALEPNP